MDLNNINCNYHIQHNINKGIVETICRPFLFHPPVKRIATQLLVTVKLNGGKESLFEKLCF